VVGPRPIVDAPTFVPSPFGLLGVLTPSSTTDPHWQNGVTWQSFCMDPMGATTYDECLVVTGVGDVPAPSVKSGNVDLTTRAATPFTAYARFDCATVGYTTEDFARIGTTALTQSESWQVENAVWTGLADGKPVVYPHLTANAEAVDASGYTLQLATSVPVTGAVNAVVGLGLLEKSLADCHNGAGIIHVPVKLLPTLDAYGVVRERNGILKTLNGNTVAVGAGYPGTSPTNVDPGDTQAWMYATGPMFLYRSQIRVMPYRESVNRSNNTVEMLAERTYVIGWDCCQSGILVDISVSTV
jgi:hypothetical protein